MWYYSSHSIGKHEVVNIVNHGILAFSPYQNQLTETWTQPDAALLLLPIPLL